MIVFDLDGTLADCEHRIHFIRGEKKDWDSYYAKCFSDAPIAPIIFLARTLRLAGHPVEIWTGRSRLVEAETQAWLHRFVGFYPNRILMREIGDHRPDFEVKAQWLDEAAVKPMLVFEDRKQMVDMWRSKGIVCCQVAPGDF